ncbi:MAG: hypothetical protein ACKVTZ_04070 [Bacteroidia bacterium]
MADIENWIIQTKQKTGNYGEIIATFVIDLDYNLLINDRHSEHVVCANGKNVLSAGEITFERVHHKAEKSLLVSQISNLSTGYCPSPSSWEAVAKALAKTGVAYPEYFTTAFEFRICKNCHWVNVIKEEDFVCANGECQNTL